MPRSQPESLHAPAKTTLQLAQSTSPPVGNTESHQSSSPDRAPTGGTHRPSGAIAKELAHLYLILDMLDRAQLVVTLLQESTGARQVITYEHIEVLRSDQSRTARHLLASASGDDAGRNKLTQTLRSIPVVGKIFGTIGTFQLSVNALELGNVRAIILKPMHRPIPIYMTANFS